jgi:hypothetical protein
MFKRSVLTGVLAVAPLLVSLTPTAASAEEAEAPDTTLTFTTSATVETLSQQGTVLAVNEAGPSLEGEWLSVPRANTPSKGMTRRKGAVSTTAWQEGFGGSSTASGCTKVTVHNNAYTVMGFLAYTYDTWTRWCWNRANENINDVTIGWDFRNSDGTQYYRGQNNLEAHFFDWAGGAPRSGYLHNRTGFVENCVIKYGCISSSYPRNVIRSRSNGTWYWATEG